MKGQARKAAAKAATAGNKGNNNPVQQQVVNLVGGRSRFDINCKTRHGLPLETIPDVCKNFMSQFITSLAYNSEKETTAFHASKLALDFSYKTFPDALNNEKYLDIIKKGLVSNGTTAILEVRENIVESLIPMCFAAALMMIDSYAPSSPSYPGDFDERDAKAWLKNLDIMNGCNRSLVKFYVNQTPCNCLDEFYTVMKKTPKMGQCVNCHEMKERSKLYICTGCERVQYCSKACQIAHAHKHKKVCRMWQSGGFTYDLPHGVEPN